MSRKFRQNQGGTVSRIILKKYNNGEDQIVVGWDRPCASYFWQEFNKEPEVFQMKDGSWAVRTEQQGLLKKFFATEAQAEEAKWDVADEWEEMKRYGGYGPNELPTLRNFRDSLPDDIRKLVTEDILGLLNKHSMDPDAGRILVDLVESA